MDYISWEHPRLGRIGEVACRAHAREVLAALNTLGIGCIGESAAAGSACLRCTHAGERARVFLPAAIVLPETPTTRVPDERACPACAGVGWTPDVMGEGAEVECPDCAGSGRGNRSITVAEQDDRRTT